MIVLLHGMTASGNTFGGAYDTFGVRTIAIDLLGFGQSMQATAGTYTATAHVDAVMSTLERIGVADCPIVVVGHSMGAVLALHLANRLADPQGVVCLSAPLYDGEDEALGRIGEADPLSSLITVGRLAERVCSLLCANRDAARVLYPLIAPHWPRQVAADGVLHTWPAYRQSLQHLILTSGYLEVLRALDARHVPVQLIDGSDDGVMVPGRAASLASRFPGVKAMTVDGAGHQLPLSHAERCADLISDLVRSWT